MSFLATIKHVLSNISNMEEECDRWLIANMYILFFNLWEKIKI